MTWHARVTHGRGTRNASRQGAVAKQSGRGFEAAIERVNAWYAHQCEAAIERVPLPTEGWGSSLRVSGPSTVDFVGTAHVDGACRGVAFDAKVVTGAASFRVGTHGTEEKDRRQLGYLLDRRNRFGYAAGYLLYCAELETCWVLTELDRLVAGESIALRTKHRGEIVHHLPHCTLPLAAAAVPHPASGRPRLDYLPLLCSPTTPEHPTP